MPSTTRGLLLLLLAGCLCGCLRAVPHVPHLNADCLSAPGDLTLALLSGFSDRGDEDLCALHPEPWVALFYQFYQGFVYALEEVNARDDLLPNITLGYVIMDTCWRDLAALGQALYLVREAETAKTNATEPEMVQRETSVRRSETDPNTQSNAFKGDAAGVREGTTDGVVTSCGDGHRKSLDVVGVVGPGSSSEAVMVAGLFSVLQLPLLATMATNDELSDKSRYEYFTRLVPPDKFQVNTILKFTSHHNWTYVSILYSEGVYGENAAKMFIKGTRARGMCVPVAEMVSNQVEKEDAEEIAYQLVKHHKARVVVIFLQQSQIKVILQALEEQQLAKHFIWISGDALADANLGPLANGAFVLSLQVNDVPSFDEHYFALTPAQQPNDPWIRFLWEMFYDCSWTANAGDNGTVLCEQYRNKPYKNQYTSGSTSLYMDGALAFAHALHRLIEKDCPNAFMEPEAARACVNGPRLLQELRDISFDGYSGSVSFDRFGDRLGTYTIKQYGAGKAPMYQAVAEYNTMESIFNVEDHKIDWILLNASAESGSIPESVCSKPCSARQYAIREDLPCCWECRECRTNEQLVTANSSSKCEVCPTLTWPDDGDGDSCQLIPPTYLHLVSVPSVTLGILGLLLVLLALVTMGWTFKWRHKKLIKASSRELSTVILAGVAMAAVTNLIMLVPPTNNATCQAATFGFHLSVAGLFIPQMLKTCRVFRIFSGAKYGQTKLRLTSNRAMIISFFGLLFIQAALTTATEVFSPTKVQLRMPFPTIPLVELFCDISLLGLLLPMVYNLIILGLCSVFGFLTRKLPDNFNETWYVFVCVTTTVFLWLVFLPVYFTTYYALYRELLLASCLLINGFVTLVCLFAPKIYAVYFVDEQMLLFAQTNFASVGVSGIVAPSPVQPTVSHIVVGVAAAQNVVQNVPAESG